MNGATRGSGAGKLFKVLGLILIPVVIVGGCAISGWNRVVTMSVDVSGKWSQVENQLQRRYDLIPNLVETVKGYAAHEQEVFTKIAEARAAYTGAASRGEKVEAANAIESALSRLLVIQERYPDLKANESFLALQSELAGTENRISVERMRYNDAVKSLNAYRRRFFGRMIASWAGVEEAKYFEMADEAKAVPKVNFSKDA